MPSGLDQNGTWPIIAQEYHEYDEHWPEGFNHAFNPPEPALPWPDHINA